MNHRHAAQHRGDRETRPVCVVACASVCVLCCVLCELKRARARVRVHYADANTYTRAPARPTDRPTDARRTATLLCDAICTYTCAHQQCVHVRARRARLCTSPTAGGCGGGGGGGGRRWRGVAVVAVCVCWRLRQQSVYAWMHALHANSRAHVCILYTFACACALYRDTKRTCWHIIRIYHMYIHTNPCAPYSSTALPVRMYIIHTKVYILLYMLYTTIMHTQTSVYVHICVHPLAVVDVAAAAAAVTRTHLTVACVCASFWVLCIPYVVCS